MNTKSIAAAIAAAAMIAIAALGQQAAAKSQDAQPQAAAGAATGQEKRLEAKQQGAGCEQGRKPIDKNLSASDIKTLAEARLIMKGDKNLKVGKVTEKDAETVAVSIVTLDDSLVREMEISRKTGRPIGRHDKRR